LSNDYPEHGLEAGMVVGMCPSTGIVYLPPFDAAVLGEALWPDDWSIVPPG
jgi:hypothetical protein